MPTQQTPDPTDNPFTDNREDALEALYAGEEEIDRQVAELNRWRDERRAAFVDKHGPAQPGDVVEEPDSSRGKVLSLTLATVNRAMGVSFAARVINIRKDGTEGSVRVIPYYRPFTKVGS